MSKLLENVILQLQVDIEINIDVEKKTNRKLASM